MSDENPAAATTHRSGDDVELNASASESPLESQVLDIDDRLYRKIYEGAPLAFVLWDTQCRISHWNKRAERMFGWTQEEILGRSFLEFLSPANAQPQVEKIVAGLLMGRVRRRTISENLTKSGETILCEWNNTVRHDEKGRVVGVMSLGLDITERKKAEVAVNAVQAELEQRVEERTGELMAANRILEKEIEERRRIEVELRNSEHKYHALIDEASDAIVICDTAGNVLDANRRAVSLFGSSKEELTRKSFTDLHPENERERHAVAFQEILREGSGSLIDGVIVRTDGMLVPVDITASVIQFGHKTLIQGLFRDVTERKRTEDVVRNIAEGVAAATGEAFFQSLVRQLARMLEMDYAFIGELGIEGKETVTTLAVWGQDGIAENFHYELTNTPCENVVGKVLCCYPQGVQEQFPQDEMLRDMNVDCYVGVPLFDSQHRPLGLIATLACRPLTHSQFVESTLRVFAARASAELERKRAEEAVKKSEMHLRFLSSELLSAQETERARIARELHDGVGQSLGTLKMRVEALLQLAKSDKGSFDPTQLSNLVPVIQKTMEEVRNTSMDLRPSTLDTLGILATFSWFCREYQVTCPSISVEKAIDVNEREVPDRLKTVLYRIVQEAFNNIAKHSEADRVKLSLSGNEGCITLTVEDNGKGFDFPAVNDSMKGLGLTSLRERAELSGGSFYIESEPGKGTRLQASWPT